MNTKPFILASASPRRKQLLSFANYIFDIVVPDVLENDDPKENSLNKAKAVALLHPERIILSADTIVICDGKILGKPKNEADALKMLLTLNNNMHTVITSFCILNFDSKILEHKSVKSKIWFGNFSTDQYKAYIKTKEPMDKAGSYGIQEIGSVFIKKITGSYTNIVGLPMYEVSIALQKIGITALI